MSRLFWLNDDQWSKIEPLLPHYGSPPRVDDRRILSGIIHVLRCGCRWCDCPSDYGPYTTVYNSFNRWSRKGIWQRIAVCVEDMDLAGLQRHAQVETLGLVRKTSGAVIDQQPVWMRRAGDDQVQVAIAVDIRKSQAFGLVVGLRQMRGGGW